MKKCEDGDDKELLYGNVVQLKHVQTGMYLKGDTFTASLEKDCLKLSLSGGDEYCHFRVMPRFKVRHEGSAAYYGDMIQLVSERLSGYSVHVTSKPYNVNESTPYVTELNLGAGASSLKIHKYAGSVPKTAKSKPITTNSDLVMFFHPESECFLSASCNEEKGGGVVTTTTTSSEEPKVRLSTRIHTHARAHTQAPLFALVYWHTRTPPSLCSHRRKPLFAYVCMASHMFL